MICACFWVIMASVIDVRRRESSQPFRVNGFASALAHAGLGISLLGIASTTVWRSEALDVLAPGQSLNVAGYTLRFNGVEPVEGPNYQAMRATSKCATMAAWSAIKHPERRSYPVEGEEISETSIRTTGFSDLYLALGDHRGGGHWSIRAYVNPMAPFIWFGGALMALGGMASWGPRARPLRTRLGAGGMKRVPLSLFVSLLFAAAALAG